MFRNNKSLMAVALVFMTSCSSIPEKVEIDAKNQSPTVENEQILAVSDIEKKVLPSGVKVVGNAAASIKTVKGLFEFSQENPKDWHEIERRFMGLSMEERALFYAMEDEQGDSFEILTVNMLNVMTADVLRVAADMEGASSIHLLGLHLMKNYVYNNQENLVGNSEEKAKEQILSRPEGEILLTLAEMIEDQARGNVAPEKIPEVWQKIGKYLYPASVVLDIRMQPEGVRTMLRILMQPADKKALQDARNKSIFVRDTVFERC